MLILNYLKQTIDKKGAAYIVLIDPDKKTVENISGNFFDKIILFNNREIIMHNNVYNTSSSFNIMGDQWTSFNENYIDIYKCKKKRH